MWSPCSCKPNNCRSKPEFFPLPTAVAQGGCSPVSGSHCRILFQMILVLFLIVLLQYIFASISLHLSCLCWYFLSGNFHPLNMYVQICFPSSYYLHLVKVKPVLIPAHFSNLSLSLCIIFPFQWCLQNISIQLDPQTLINVLFVSSSRSLITLLSKSRPNTKSFSSCWIYCLILMHDYLFLPPVYDSLASS